VLEARRPCRSSARRTGYATAASVGYPPWSRPTITYVRPCPAVGDRMQRQWFLADEDIAIPAHTGRRECTVTHTCAAKSRQIIGVTLARQCGSRFGRDSTSAENRCALLDKRGGGFAVILGPGAADVTQHLSVEHLGKAGTLGKIYSLLHVAECNPRSSRQRLRERLGFSLEFQVSDDPVDKAQCKSRIAREHG
jgi:hypothetical protein